MSEILAVYYCCMRLNYTGIRLFSFQLFISKFLSVCVFDGLSLTLLTYLSPSVSVSVSSCSILAGAAFSESYLVLFKLAFRKVRMKQILSLSEVSLLYLGQRVEISFTYGIPVNLNDVRRNDLPSPPSTPLIEVQLEMILTNNCNRIFMIVLHIKLGESFGNIFVD